MTLTHMLPYMVLAVVVALAATGLIVRRAVVARARRIEVGHDGPDVEESAGMLNILGLRTRRHHEASPLDHGQGAGEVGDPMAAPDPPDQGYPAGSKGHPLSSSRGAQRSAAQALPLPLGRSQHDGRRHEETPESAAGVSSPPAPPVFAGTSASGQAPWHLPVGAAPSGLAADGVRLGDLEVRAASMVGAGHRCQEPATPRQDAYALGRTEDGRYLIVAVADGVSQSRHADIGARVAVSAATRELARMLVTGGLRAIDVRMLHKVIAGEMIGTARSRKISEDDTCSILITAVVPARPRPDGTRQMWASWIGDVSLWVSRDGGLLRRTGQEKDGLDRNTLSAVLPFNLDQAEQATFDLEPADRVAVMTDGLSDSISSVAGVAEYFGAQWAGAPPHPAAFLHSMCYDGPGQTDDRTAVVVWCGTPQPGNRRATGERLPG